jgi:hypothetical protein
MRKTPRILHRHSNRDANKTSDFPPTARAKYHRFAPSMWDPRKVAQNSKLPERAAIAMSYVAIVAA